MSGSASPVHAQEALHLWNTTAARCGWDGVPMTGREASLRNVIHLADCQQLG